MEPAAPARIVYVGGPRDGQEDALELPGRIPTILPVDEPPGCYVRDRLRPDGQWRMIWRGFGENAG
jgi:hypothetical protein